MEVDLVHGGAVKPGETAEVVHDLGHPLHSLSRALEDLVEVLLDIREIAFLAEPLDLAQQLRPVCRQQVVRLLVDRHQMQQRGIVAFQNGQVIGDVGERIVDLMSHSGAQHAKRGELLGLNNPGVHLVAIDELADLAAQLFIISSNS